MRIYKKTVKDCETTKWEKEKVLELKYSHNGEKGIVLVRNYDERLYKKIKETLNNELETLVEEKKKEIEEKFEEMWRKCEEEKEKDNSVNE